ncbi:unnamed protein product [Schistosoma margrebowiei]|uniref:Uncharacterized protein n=1 Tax=Schistosoma margrebowiei TaxID=48269 RepID=A0A183LMM1_9TREM|nr:unnamed protein product [Schistosoma margrebowiei]
MVSKIRLKVKKHWTARKTGLQRFNTLFLRHTDKVEEFEITVNRFQTLRDVPKEETTMEDNWKETEEALTPACQKFLARNKHHH